MLTIFQKQTHYCIQLIFINIIYDSSCIIVLKNSNFQIVVNEKFCKQK